MKCPHCETADLNITHRLNVELDFCPKCRGVWLDRGELDKILAQAKRYADEDDDRYDRDGIRPDPRRDEDYRQQHKSRRKAFWSDLFD